MDTVNNNKKKIMIIDNETDIVNLFKDFLEFNGYNIDEYTNPMDALNNFRKHSHDLIILDLKMPKMNGITVYHKIKEIDEQIIICLTTANKNLIQDFQKHITDIEKIVIYKPFLLKDLKNKIESLFIS